MFLSQIFSFHPSKIFSYCINFFIHCFSDEDIWSTICIYKVRILHSVCKLTAERRYKKAAKRNIRILSGENYVNTEHS